MVGGTSEQERLVWCWIFRSDNQENIGKYLRIIGLWGAEAICVAGLITENVEHLEEYDCDVTDRYRYV